MINGSQWEDDWADRLLESVEEREEDDLLREMEEDRATQDALLEEKVDIVFDGPPGPESGRFVEVESPPGRSISFGEWVEREDGYWALRITVPQPSREQRARWMMNTREMLDRMITAAAEEEGVWERMIQAALRELVDIGGLAEQMKKEIRLPGDTDGQHAMRYCASEFEQVVLAITELEL